MKDIPNNNILSAKSKKTKKVADEKPYFENTHQIFTPSWIDYKNPSLNDNSDSEEDGEPIKGKAILKKIYGGCSSCKKELDKEVSNYNLINKHLEEHLKEKAGDPKDAIQAKYFKKEIKRVSDLHLISANKIPKRDPLYKVSNPKEVQKKAKEIYGKTAIVYKSSRPNKKYQILNTITGKWVFFGDAKMEDFTKHQDKKRQDNYLKRSMNIKGNWRQNPFSPNCLSILLLW